MLFCSFQNAHFISSPCANFPDSQKVDVFSQFIKSMYSYVALGFSPLGLNRCSSPNFNVIHLFRNEEEEGGFALQNLHYWFQSRSPQYQHSGSGPVPVLGLLGTRPPQKEVSFSSVSEASTVLQLLPVTLSSPPEGTVQLVFLELFVVT